jgi:hypothetical protein
VGSTPKPPKPPDPTQTANAQWGFTKNALNYSADLNTPNLYTPFGSTTYQKDASGRPISQTVNLNAQDQALLDNQRSVGMGLSGQALQQLQNMPNSPFRVSDIGVPLPGTQDYSDWGNKIAQNSYNQRMDLIRPDIEQGRARLEQRLSDQGLPQSGEAGSTLTGNYERGVNNAYNQAAQGALADSGNEMSRLYGLQNQQFNTALQSALTERGMPFNELAQYLGATPQSPYQSAQAINPLQAQAPDFMGATNANYQGRMDAYRAKMAQNAGMWQGIGGLAGNIFAAAGQAGGFGSLFG